MRWFEKNWKLKKISVGDCAYNWPNWANFVPISARISIKGGFCKARLSIRREQEAKESICRLFWKIFDGDGIRFGDFSKIIAVRERSPATLFTCSQIEFQNICFKLLAAEQILSTQQTWKLWNEALNCF